MTTAQSRQPQGRPTGGQFAENDRAEGSVTLASDRGPFAALTEQKIRVYYFRNDDESFTAIGAAEAKLRLGIDASATDSELEAVAALLAEAGDDRMYVLTESTYAVPDSADVLIDLSNEYEFLSNPVLIYRHPEDPDTVLAQVDVDLGDEWPESAAEVITTRMGSGDFADVGDGGRLTIHLQAQVPADALSPRIIADALSAEDDRVDAFTVLRSVQHLGILVGDDAFLNATADRAETVRRAARLGYMLTDRDAVSIAREIAATVPKSSDMGSRMAGGDAHEIVGGIARGFVGDRAGFAGFAAKTAQRNGTARLLPWQDDVALLGRWVASKDARSQSATESD